MLAQGTIFSHVPPAQRRCKGKRALALFGDLFGLERPQEVSICDCRNSSVISEKRIKGKIKACGCLELGNKQAMSGAAIATGGGQDPESEFGHDQVKVFSHEGDDVEGTEHLNSMDLHDVKSELEKDAEKAEVSYFAQARREGERTLGSVKWR